MSELDPAVIAMTNLPESMIGVTFFPHILDDEWNANQPEQLNPEEVKE